MSTGVEIQGTAVALSSPDKSPLCIVLQCLNNKCFEKQVLCDKVEPSKIQKLRRFIHSEMIEDELMFQVLVFMQLVADDLELSRPVIALTPNF
ncbi:hypothetical protein T07_7111 [Trichinella nelsoni]|uniref:Uncharacterized protein n=1 Tax=Trichinella nelsoni TaxID=6336 RepID=A0A0V0RUZ2_9BILA|nr:hypothetical protein T07_7111 [Trichinella nelsoni]